VKFDIFLSICQTEVGGYLPTERVMFENFFDQIRLADELGFGCAWVAETHLSCQVQKRNPGAVIPHFKGEIGLNTDILQLAHKVFAQTKRIHIGSAIRNILCNGGPMAHAEAVRTFLTLHGMDSSEDRLLELGFASGRFPFSNVPYGIRPRNDLEKGAWSVLRGMVFQEATEIFLRFLREICMVPDSKISANIRIFEHQNANQLLQFWQKTTKIPLSKFHKFYYGVSKSSLGKRPFNILPYGTIQIVVGDTKLYHKIMGWIKGLGNN
jgi:alkanesulfonate monooxygenase SsuD/methylene tetrahydromethanopterin reductase-like flavin-dependent oxidoreductase (luciferase family)